MTTYLEKLETLKAVFQIASVVLIVAVIIMLGSIIYINKEIRKYDNTTNNTRTQS